jgi:pimeloyl-ACP methyl ester carboxylesterase
MSNSKELSRDIVVLVHGLAANSLVMAPLARALRREFPLVINWGYRSLWSPIERHGEALARRLSQLDERAPGKIHLVTHSMGGIIGRLALKQYAPERLGRFLMIAPPNRGSHVATWLAPWLGRICPPLQQLADDMASFVCQLPHPEVDDLGIIAAANDYFVPEHCTRLGCERDYIVLPGLHSSLLWSKQTAQQATHFLRHGRFAHEAATASHRSQCLAAHADAA